MAHKYSIGQKFIVTAPDSQNTCSKGTAVTLERHCHRGYGTGYFMVEGIGRVEAMYYTEVTAVDELKSALSDTVTAGVHSMIDEHGLATVVSAIEQWYTFHAEVNTEN